MFTFYGIIIFSQFVFVIHICNSKEGKPGSSLVSTDVRFDSPGKQISKYLVGSFTVSIQIDTVIELRRCKSNLSVVDTKHRTERQKRILVFAVVVVS